MTEIRQRIRKPEPTSARGGTFWIVVAVGAATIVLIGLAATMVALSFWDRHSNLSEVLDFVWFHVGNIVDSPGFVVAYLVIPVAWTALAVSWWWKRSPRRRRVPVVVRILYFSTALVGAGAWLISLLWRIRSVFDPVNILQLVAKVGVSSADLREPLVVLGLSCLFAVVLINVAMMLDETLSQPSDASATST